MAAALRPGATEAGLRMSVTGCAFGCELGCAFGGAEDIGPSGTADPAGAGLIGVPQWLAGAGAAPGLCASTAPATHARAPSAMIFAFIGPPGWRADQRALPSFTGWPRANRQPCPVDQGSGASDSLLTRTVFGSTGQTGRCCGLARRLGTHGP